MADILLSRRYPGLPAIASSSVFFPPQARPPIGPWDFPGNLMKLDSSFSESLSQARAVQMPAKVGKLVPAFHLFRTGPRNGGAYTIPGQFLTAPEKSVMISFRGRIFVGRGHILFSFSTASVPPSSERFN